METETMVKRVIDGKAYNTDTAELLAKCVERPPYLSEALVDHRVYRTRGGAYFETWLDDNGDTQLEPLSKDKAKAIVTGVDPDYQKLKFNIVGNADDLLGDVPDASADDGADQQAVIFFRVSKSFKAAIEETAKKSGLSVNAWLLRACEETTDKTAAIFKVQNLLDEISDAFTKEVTKENATYVLNIALVKLFLTAYMKELVVHGKGHDEAIASVVRGDTPIASIGNTAA